MLSAGMTGVVDVGAIVIISIADVEEEVDVERRLGEKLAWKESRHDFLDLRGFMRELI